MPLDNLVHKSRVCWLRTKLSRYFAFNEYGWPATVTPKKRLRMEKKQQHQATASTVDGGDKTFHRKIPLRATRLSYLHFLFKIHIFFFFIWLQRRFLHSLSSSIERIQLNGEFVFACVCVCAAFLHSVWEAFKIFKGHHFFSAFPVERAVVASSSQHQWSYNYTYTKHTCEKKTLNPSYVPPNRSVRFFSLSPARSPSLSFIFFYFHIHTYIYIPLLYRFHLNTISLSRCRGRFVWWFVGITVAPHERYGNNFNPHNAKGTASNSMHFHREFCSIQYLWVTKSQKVVFEPKINMHTDFFPYMAPVRWIMETNTYFSWIFLFHCIAAIT